MNNIIQTIRHAARAAAVLLIALLTAQTAWAQGNIPEVSNADDLASAFRNTDVSKINVTKDITDVGGLSLNHALTINLNGHTISGDGLHFVVGTDHSLTINEEGGGSVGNITSGYADGPAIDNNGTVTISHVNITTNYNCAIQGGTLIIGNNVSFNGWTEMPFDAPNVNIIEGGNYNYDRENPLANVVATVTVGGKTHYFENSGAALAYITNNAGKVDFSWSKSDDTYTIHTATGWDAFCDLLADNDKGFFTGKTVQLGADIGTADDPVTRMAGTAYHDFTGTFDGDGHTLTVGYGTADAPFGEQYAALSRTCTWRATSTPRPSSPADWLVNNMVTSPYRTAAAASPSSAAWRTLTTTAPTAASSPISAASKSTSASRAACSTASCSPPTASATAADS